MPHSVKKKRKEKRAESRLKWLEDRVENAEIEAGGVDNSFTLFNFGN